MELLIHVDLKMMVPTLDALKQDIVRWANEGATGIVFEWENTFPYPGLEDATRAFSSDDIQQLIATCKSNGLLAIPLIQTLGHLEWLLAHEKYARLREFGDYANEIRACDDEVWALLDRKLDAILEAHRDCPYVHLGADEAFRLKEVDRPDCSSVREGTGAVFLRHMEPLLKKAIAAGKRPIIWADMVLRHPEYLDRFPKEVIFCDWLYSQTREYDASAQGWDLPRISAETLPEIPTELRELYEPYWRMESPDFPNLVYQFPYTPFLRDRGFDVIVGPAALYGGFPLSGPDLPHARANQREWLKAGERFGAIGALNTCWQVRGALREQCDAGHRAFLTMGTNGTDGEDADLARECCMPIAAGHSAEASELMDSLDPPRGPLTYCGPHYVDTTMRAQRMVGFDQRLVGLSEELSALDEGAEDVLRREQAVERGRALSKGLVALGLENEEIASWALGADEMSLRARIWLNIFDHAKGRPLRDGLSSLAGEIERQAEAYTTFMGRHYMPEDASMAREDRYGSLLRLVRALA